MTLSLRKLCATAIKKALAPVLLGASIGEHVHRRDQCSSCSGTTLTLYVVLEDDVQGLDVEAEVVVGVAWHEYPWIRCVPPTDGAMVH